MTALNQLLSTLLHTAGTFESHVEARLAAVGLSLPKFAALRVLSGGEAVPFGQLAERLACVKSNVTQLVDRLEADGFVLRSSDPVDRRSRLATITAAGRRAYDQAVAIHQQVEQELFGVLTAEESAALLRLMDKLDQGRL